MWVLPLPVHRPGAELPTLCSPLALGNHGDLGTPGWTGEQFCCTLEDTNLISTGMCPVPNRPDSDMLGAHAGWESLGESVIHTGISI